MTLSAISPARLAMAYALDLVVGDPEWFPHHGRATGEAISAGDGTLRCLNDSKSRETIKGAILAGSWALARTALRSSECLPAGGCGD